MGGRTRYENDRVKAFYDSQVARKIRDFVEGNRRINCAWKTITQWAPIAPTRILEIGCGIGANAWRMSKEWPNALITGIDISTSAVEVANKLFANDAVSFVEGSFDIPMAHDSFDLIVLIDVYEHIEENQKNVLHEMLINCLSPKGRIILSFPTRFHQEWLIKNAPQELQPVDETIQLPSILKLAKDVEREVLLYKKVDVWRQGDYAHAVLGNKSWLEIPCRSCSDSPETESGRKLVAKLMKRIKQRLLPKRNKKCDREERARFVEERLGVGIF